MGTVFGDNCSDVIFVCVSLSGELGGGGAVSLETTAVM